MGIILTLISAILSIILYPFLLIYAIIRYSKFEAMNKHYFDIAVSIDKMSNVVSKYLFNDIMIKKGGQEFGTEGETISSVLGKNYKAGALTIIGLILSQVLGFFQKDHVIISIDNNKTDQIK